MFPFLVAQNQASSFLWRNKIFKNCICHFFGNQIIYLGLYIYLCIMGQGVNFIENINISLFSLGWISIIVKDNIQKTKIFFFLFILILDTYVLNKKRIKKSKEQESCLRRLCVLVHWIIYIFKFKIYSLKKSVLIPLALDWNVESCPEINLGLVWLQFYRL